MLSIFYATSSWLQLLYLFMCSIQIILAGVIIRNNRDTRNTGNASHSHSADNLIGNMPTVFNGTEVARAQLERDARIETEALLNGLFRTQIEYFSKVKKSLAPETQRVHDIDAYIARLNEAIAVEGVEEKDRMWINIFQEFNKSPLLLNKQSETGVTNEEYLSILSENGLQQILKNFLADLAIYFWKMAKTSGKVVEVAIDEYLQSKRFSLQSLLFQ